MRAAQGNKSLPALRGSQSHDSLSSSSLGEASRHVKDTQAALWRVPLGEERRPPAHGQHRPPATSVSHQGSRFSSPGPAFRGCSPHTAPHSPGIEITLPRVTGVRKWGLRECSGHEGAALVSAVNGLIKEVRGSSSPLPPWEDTAVSREVSEPGTWASPNTSPLAPCSCTPRRLAL